MHLPLKIFNPYFGVVEICNSQRTLYDNEKRGTKYAYFQKVCIDKNFIPELQEFL